MPALHLCQQVSHTIGGADFRDSLLESGRPGQFPARRHYNGGHDPQDAHLRLKSPGLNMSLLPGPGTFDPERPSPKFVKPCMCEARSQQIASRYVSPHVSGYKSSSRRAGSASFGRAGKRVQGWVEFGARVLWFVIVWMLKPGPEAYHEKAELDRLSISRRCALVAHSESHRQGCAYCSQVHAVARHATQPELRASQEDGASVVGAH